MSEMPFSVLESGKDEGEMRSLWQRSIRQGIEDGDYVLNDLGEYCAAHGFLKGKMDEVLAVDAWLAGAAEETPEGVLRRLKRQRFLEQELKRLQESKA